MLTLVILSLGTAFASDDNVTEELAVDEITVDEDMLAIEQDTQVLSEDESTASRVIINNSNLKEYIDESGGINENITADELIFEGTFENLNLSVNHPFKITGYNASLIDPNILILSSNVTFSGFTINQTKGPNSIFIAGFEDNIISDVIVSDVTIDFVDNAGGADAIAIDVLNTDNFSLVNSVINYVGNTNGSYVNNAVSISNSSRPTLHNNKFKISLVSARVNWVEEPAGSWNYVAYPFSEGIVVANSNGAVFDGNIVNVNYTDIAGSDDTIYSVVFKNSDNAVISNNDIVAYGHTYVYGIQMNGNDFTISKNNISAASDNYYACGIDIEGVATGVVEANVINIKAINSAYAVYSGMNYKDVKARYVNNTITGEAYNIFGFSLGDVESEVIANKIFIDGNYTTGIAYTGSLINAADNRLVLLSSEVGNETIWENFGVEAVGVKVIQGNATLTNNVISTSGKGVSLTGATNAKLENNFINIASMEDKDAYAIYAVDIPKAVISNNTVDYQGNTNGTGINNAVYINNVTEAYINDNKFDLGLVSAYIDWVEEPAGSWNYVQYPISEGIVVANSNGVVFDDNIVNVNYVDIAGSWDTIYAVDFKNSTNALISKNNITASGHTYIYGIIITSANFTIRDNQIYVISDIDYANGINPDAGASGIIENNTITAIGVESSYPIYSHMSGSLNEFNVDYINNQIYGNAYYVVGLDLGGEDERILNNTIIVEGNYTLGIWSDSLNNTISGNTIKSLGSSVGNQSVYTQTTAIKISKANAVISDNYIEAITADYAIDLGNTNSTVENSYIASKKSVGDNAIVNAGPNVVVANINPSLKTIISAPTLYAEYVEGVVFPVVALDENGDPIANITIFATINGVVYNETTTTEGYAAFVLDLNAGNYEVAVSFNGNDVYAPKSVTSYIIVDSSASEIVAPASSSVFLTSVNAGSYIKVTLKDINDNGLANKLVTITFNGIPKVYTTDELGEINYKLSATKVGTYSLVMKFAGDNNYVSSEATTTVKINKQASKITAKAKTFKAKTKTKKYTITLKDSNGKAIKKAVVKIKVKGKTYKAKTNSKGKATFKIAKLTKKGKYKAKITFATTKYYKAATKSVYITVKK